MAYNKVYETDPKIEIFLITDPANIVDENIENKTSKTLELTFVKDSVKGTATTLVPDDTVPIPTVAPGETITVTAAMQNDAIAAGDHSDIYISATREVAVSTVPAIAVIRGGQTQPD